MVEDIRSTFETRVPAFSNDRNQVHVIVRYILNSHVKTCFFYILYCIVVIQVNLVNQSITNAHTDKLTEYGTVIFFDRFFLRTFLHIYFCKIKAFCREHECICMINCIVNAFSLRELFFEDLDRSNGTTFYIRFQTCSKYLHSVRS